MPVALIEPVKQAVRKRPRILMADTVEDIVAFCPKCKTLETIYFTEDGMMPTRKFREVGTRVYHACGSVKPCRLYRSF